MGSLVVSNITQYIFSWLDILKNCKVSCTFECKFVLWITIIHTQCDHVIYQSDQGHSLESERGAINNYIGTTGITGTVSNNLGLWDFLFIPCEWRRVFSHSMYTVPLRFLVLSFFLNQFSFHRTHCLSTPWCMVKAFITFIPAVIHWALWVCSVFPHLH